MVNPNNENDVITTTDICTAISTILNFIEGTKTLRKELEKTPLRVFISYKELFDGYTTNIPDIFKTFEEGGDEVVLARGIPFTSWCEHHWMQFSGVAHVAYLPKNNKIIGASKIPRLVNAYAHRLQIQERMTRQVADEMMRYLKPLGVAVIIEAKHSCISCRGVKNDMNAFVTSIMLGAFRKSSSLRAELLSLVKLNGE